MPEHSADSQSIHDNLDPRVFLGDQGVRLTPDEALLVQHATTILGPVREAVFSEDSQEGNEDGVQWRRAELIGKQQAVAIVDITFPDRPVLPTVFRPTHGMFREFYQEYPVVRTYFPKLYMSTTVPYGAQGTRELLVVEKLNGYHGDYQTHSTIQEYRDLIATPKGFEQLCQDAFAASDTIHQLPLAFTDIAPLDGHNFIYNTGTKRFQPFDVDSLLRSDQPRIQKFVDIIEKGINRHSLSELDAAFALRMMQLYIDAHPDDELRWESDIFALAQYAITDELQPSDGILLQTGSEEYEQAYRGVVDWMGTGSMPRENDYPVLKKVVRTGRNVLSIDPEMREAIMAGDVERFKALIEDTKRAPYHKLFITAFVETSAEDPQKIDHSA